MEKETMFLKREFVQFITLFGIVISAVNVRYGMAEINLSRGLLGSYYEGMSLTELRGSRIDSSINFYWKLDAPKGVGLDEGDNNTFSAKWIGYVKPQRTGSYRFIIRSSDGIRLRINNKLVIDNWIVQRFRGSKKESTAIYLEADQAVPIELEYFERLGSAAISLQWAYNDEQPVIVTDLWHQTSGDDEFESGLIGRYFEGYQFNQFRGSRIDSNIAFNWQHESPQDVGLTVDDHDTFSVRWQGFIKPEQTDGYYFHAFSDDGVRLYIGNELVIDNWILQPYTESVSEIIYLTGGYEVPIQLEYYEYDGVAAVALEWSQDGVSSEKIPDEMIWHIENDDPEPAEQRRILTMILEFNDLTADWTSTELYALLYSQANSVKHLFELSSDQQVTLSEQNSDIITVSINANASNSCADQSWANSADDIAENLGFSLNEFDHRMYVLPSGVPCGWAGLGSVGGPRTWIKVAATNNNWMREVLAHELGHNLGLGHSGHENYKGNGFYEYGDHSGFMGNPSSPYKLIAPHREYLSWISELTKVRTLTANLDSNTTLTLTAMDDPDESVDQVIKIPVNNGTFYVSYRVEHATFGVDGDHDEKLHVHYLPLSNYPKPLLREVLSLGEEKYISNLDANISFKEIDGNVVTIEISNYE